MEDTGVVRVKRLPEKQALARQMRREMTPSEAKLWQCLRNNHLYGLHFRRQQVIDGFIVDFYCREARLVIECDGDVHISQEAYDAERDRIIGLNNLRVLRFTNTRIQQDLPAVLIEIANVAREYLYQP